MEQVVGEDQAKTEMGAWLWRILHTILRRLAFYPVGSGEPLLEFQWGLFMIKLFFRNTVLQLCRGATKGGWNQRSEGQWLCSFHSPQGKPWGRQWWLGWGLGADDAESQLRRTIFRTWWLIGYRCWKRGNNWGQLPGFRFGWLHAWCHQCTGVQLGHETRGWD